MKKLKLTWKKTWMLSVHFSLLWLKLVLQQQTLEPEKKSFPPVSQMKHKWIHLFLSQKHRRANNSDQIKKLRKMNHQNFFSHLPLRPSIWKRTFLVDYFETWMVYFYFFVIKSKLFLSVLNIHTGRWSEKTAIIEREETWYCLNMEITKHILRHPPGRHLWCCTLLCLYYVYVICFIISKVTESCVKNEKRAEREVKNLLS